MRVFHLTAKTGTASHPDWNGCSLDRRCQVWTQGDEAHARELAHKKFWQESTPVNPDRTSPWTNSEMVECAEAAVLPGMPVPVEDAVFSWGDRVRSPVGHPAGSEGALHAVPRPSPDPTKKLDQH